MSTEWNTDQRPLPATVQRQPGQVFGTFAPNPVYGEAELALPVGPERSLPTSPVELLKEPSHDPFLGFDREDVRLTIANDEDWDHALAIYEALGPERLDWQRIARLLDHQPALRSRMAVLNRVHQRPVRVGEG